MPILKGFPPSNTIHEGIREPWVRETVVKAGSLKPEERFRHGQSEFFVISVLNSGSCLRAVCYKAGCWIWNGCGPRQGSLARIVDLVGEISCFPLETEVTWLERVWDWSLRPKEQPIELKVTWKELSPITCTVTVQCPCPLPSLDPELDEFSSIKIKNPNKEVE